MTLWDYYLRYMREICEGEREAPEGIVLTEEEPMKRAMEIQQRTGGDIPSFVRACAQAEDADIPQTLYDGFDPNELFSALSQAAGEAAPVVETREEAPAPDPDAGKHPFEVFLDCLSLDERLVQYLIDVLKRDDRLAFFKLSQITTRMDLDPREFLLWLGSKELYAGEEERSCAVLMDACLQRLMAEGQGQLAAALLSGDQATFEAFRCEAPELVHVPAATFDWFSRNYLDQSYPIRFLLRAGGVEFPGMEPG